MPAIQAPILSNDQWEAAYQRCEAMERPQMYRLLLGLIRDCGLRPLELAGMQRHWVNPGELRIPIGYSKGGKGRTVPLTPRVESALCEHLRASNGAFVFTNRSGVPFNNQQISKAISRMLKRTIGTGSAYSGRRGFAHSLNRAGVDLPTIQRLMGHRSVLTTISYIPITLDDMREAQSRVTV